MRYIIGIALATMLALCIFYAYQYDALVNADHKHVTVLMHACIPTDTGGGVTQCYQPTQYDITTRKMMDDLRLCIANTAYTRDMIPQCIDDITGH